MKALYFIAAILFVTSVYGFTRDKNIADKNKFNTGAFNLNSKANELCIEQSRLEDLLSSIEDSIQVDALNQELTINGIADSKMGTSVANAGDVNGDGFSDIIVGAPGYSSNTGIAFIYFGGLSMDNEPDVIMTGEAVNNNFGGTVCSAGDVNGDGFSDVIIGASGYNSNTGRAYLFYGGAIMNAVVDIYFSSPQVNIAFGFSVSGGGDVNGDGYSDVIVGAPDADNLTGKAYVYYGGISMDNSLDLTLAGEALNNGFGLCVSNGGDFNGDGFNDVFISSPRYSSSLGRVYLYYGGANMNNTADIIFTGESNGNQFGISAANASDINGDGYTDVIIGASAYNSNSGRAYIYKGGALPDNAADLILNGEAAGSLFGSSVSSAGDMNGDGYGDVIVGAYGYLTSKGRAYIYFGNPIMDNGMDGKFTGEAANGSFGISIACAGDINSDGYSDIIIGASTHKTNSGKVYLYTNKLTGIDVPDETFNGIQQSGFFGYAVAGIGDVNGDGYSDFLIGSYGVGPVLNDNRGTAYLFYGGLNFDNIPDVIFPGLKSQDRFGYSVAGAGDVNRDGFNDVIIGAPGKDSTNGADAGAAYIFYGGTSMDNIADVVMIGRDTSDAFGYSVAGAGDVNNDGFDDVVIGAYLHSNTFQQQGEALVFLGGSPMNNAFDFLLSYDFALASTRQHFGKKVAGAGDVNNDGFDDIIVSASDRDSSRGAALVYYGGTIMFSTPNVILEEEVKIINNSFGYDVTGAGDVNGDGFDDVIVGSFPSTGTGNVYLFFGGSIMNNKVDLILYPEVNNKFGSVLNGAGDINNDGYDDILVGCNAYGNCEVYTYFGGANMDNIYDVKMKQLDNEGFGNSITSAGDINKDGNIDILIGAPIHSSEASSKGRAYLYLSSSPAIVPRVSSIKDVPNDQGGFVNINWVRSGYDERGTNRVTNYIIERSKPPASTGFQWEQIANISAINNLMYSYTAATWSDSNSRGNGNTYYRVTARTANNNEYWRSNIMYGHSVDNLVPSIPLYLSSFQLTNAVEISWQAVPDTDLHYYRIYRNDTLLNISLTNNFTDTFGSDKINIIGEANKKNFGKNKSEIAPQNNTPDASVLYQYKISSVDVNNNESPLSAPLNVNFSLLTAINITIIPEGFYNISTGRLNSRDTVWAYLRNTTAPYTIVDSASAVIDSITFTANFEFRNANDGTYYIVIKHRNSLETWSKTGGEAYQRGVASGYDFTNNNSQSFGSNMIQKNSKWCIISGDVFKDGTIDANDRGICWNAKNLTGYRQEDVNGDGVVDAQDRGIIWNNRNKTVQKPL